jgi:hypothetical protein
MRARAAACLTVALGICAAASPAGAAPGHGGAGLVPADAWWEAPAAVRAGGMSLDSAVAMVQRRYNGKVVRAEETREGDDVVYRIRVLSADGRVFSVRVNARTGQMD